MNDTRKDDKEHVPADPHFEGATPEQLVRALLRPVGNPKKLEKSHGAKER